MFTYIVYAFYTAVMTSWMTSKEPLHSIKVILNASLIQIKVKSPNSLKNFGDLLRQNYKLYFWEGTLQDEFLSKVTFNTFKSSFNEISEDLSCRPGRRGTFFMRG